MRLSLVFLATLLTIGSAAEATLVPLRTRPGTIRMAHVSPSAALPTRARAAAPAVQLEPLPATRPLLASQVPERAKAAPVGAPLAASAVAQSPGIAPERIAAMAAAAPSAAPPATTAGMAAPLTLYRGAPAGMYENGHIPRRAGTASAGPAVAAAPASAGNGTFYDSEARRNNGRGVPSFDLAVSNGYRHASADWNIAADPSGRATPNVLSELKWRKLQSYVAEGEASYTKRQGMLRGVHLEGAAHGAWIVSGKNQDSDYLGNDRTQEFSRSNNDAGGDMNGWRAAAGYAFEIGEWVGAGSRDLVTLTPYAGYSKDTVNLNITDGFQTIPANGAFDGLDSEYDMTWKGPFVGLGLENYSDGLHHFTLKAEYRQGDYNGRANWNLRPDFARPLSFEHDADAYGFRLAGRYGYLPYEWLEVFGSAALEWNTTGSGTDRTYLTDGRTVTTRLNEANFDSQQFQIGLAYKW